MLNPKKTATHCDDNSNTYRGTASTEPPRSSRAGYFSSWKHSLLTLFALTLTLLLVGIGLLLYATEPLEAGALRCKCMQGIIVRPGIFFYLVKPWVVTASIVFLATFVDLHHGKPRPFRSRLFIAAAILVTTTFATVGYYGATVDSTEWRIYTDDGGISDPDKFHRNMGAPITGDVVFD